MNKFGIKEKVLEEILTFAQESELNKVILFGSRARGDFSRTSDIDLAIEGGNQTQFYFNINEETSTLLKFDIIDLNNPISKELLSEINRDGIIIYEKTGSFS